MGTLTFAAGVTEQTLYINTIPLGPQGIPPVPSTNFTVSLNSPSLDVLPSANPLNEGVKVADGPATVSIIETSTVTQSSVAATLQSGGISPPDIAAAVGTPSFPPTWHLRHSTPASL